METNVIYNEDCLEGMKRIPDGSIDMILSDPPFGQDIGYGRTKLGLQYIKNDDNLNWLPTIADEMYRVLKKESHCLIFGQWRTMYDFKVEFEKVGFETKTIAVWDKKNASLGNGFAEQYENILIFRKGKAKANKFVGNIFKYPRISGRPEHPHQKPIELLTELIELSSNKNDIILDPFIGSGSTAVACLKTNRKFIGFELEEEYYNTALKRIGKFDKSYYDELPEEERPSQLQMF